MRPRRLKLGTHVDSGQMYRVYQNQAAAAYILPFISSFIVSDFLNIKIFRHPILRNCEAYKIETWYTRRHWAGVSCIPESGCCCCCLFSQELWGLEVWILVHTWKMGGCIVYTRIRLLLRIVPLFLLFFSFFFLQFSHFKSFRHIFLRNCKA